MAARVIGTATIDVKADTSQFKSALRGLDLGGVNGALNHLKSTIAALGLGHLAKEAIDFGAEYRKQIDNATAAMLGLAGANGTPGEAFRQVSSFATGAAVDLSGLTDAERDAAELMRKVTEYAIKTPLDLPGVQDATTRMLAFGQSFGVTKDNVIEYVDVIANAAVSTGKGTDAMNNVITTLGKISGQGRVMTRDMNQLTANFPSLHPWEVLSELSGKTVEELRALSLKPGGLSGVVDSTEYINALVDAMREMPGAAGAMDRQMQTLGGTVEFFKDSIGVALGDGLQPFFAALQEMMRDPAIMEGLNGLIRVFSELATALVQGLAPYMPDLIQAFTDIVAALIPAAPALGALVSIFAIGVTALAPFLELLAQALTVVAEFVAGLDPSILEPIAAGLLAIWLVGFSPIGLIIAAVTALAIVIRNNWDTIVEHTEGLVDFFKDAWPKVKKAVLDAVAAVVKFVEEWWPKVRDAAVDAVKAVVKFVQEWWPKIKSAVVDSIGAVVSFVEENWPKVQAVIAAVVDWLVNTAWPLIQQVAQWIGDRIGELVTVFQEHWGAIKEAVADAWTIIQQVITIAAAVIVGLVMALVETVSFIWDHFGEHIVSVLEIAWNFILATISFAIEMISAVIGAFAALLTGDWSALWENIKQMLSAAWDFIKAIITTVLDEIQVILSAAWEAIKIAASAAWDALKWATGIAWDLIKGVITVPIEAARDAVGAVWDAIKSAADTAWDAIKSAAETVWDAIGGFVSAPIEAAKDAIGTAWDTIKTAGETAWGLIQTAVETAWNAIGDAIWTPIQGAYDQIVRIVDLIRSALSNVPGLGGLSPDDGSGAGVGARAAGGPVKRGHMYIVGEKRPELFIPGANGYIAPEVPTPGRAMEAAGRSGLDQLVASHQGGVGGFNGPLVTMPGAVIEDATDARLVAQSVVAAMTALAVA